MYTQNPWQKTSLNVNEETEGESIEAQVRRLTNNKEPIKNASPLIYSERKDGVQPQFNIRNDKWEQMTETSDLSTKQQLAERQGRIDDKTAQDEGYQDAADKKTQLAAQEVTTTSSNNNQNQ
jgi:hypothetical protein